MQDVDGGHAALDRLAGLIAAALECPVAAITLTGDARFAAGSHGLDGLGDADLALAVTLCSAVMAAHAPVLVADVRTDPRYAARPVAELRALVGFAGAPVRDGAGVVTGALCALTPEPRSWSARDRRVLDALTAAVTDRMVPHRSPAQRGRLPEAFDAAPVAVAVTRGPGHEVEYANPAFRRIVGDTGLVERGLGAVLDRVLATGEAHRVQEDLGERGGEPRYVDLSCSAVADGAAAPHGVLVIAADVTAQVRARREEQERADRQEAAARATAAVGGSLDPRTELDALARSVVPELADLCTVYLFDHPVPPGRAPAVPVSAALVAAAGPPGVALPATPQGGLTWSRRSPLTEAVRAGRPVRAGTDPDRPPDWATDLGVARMWHSPGVHTVVTVPVITSGLVLAVIAFIALRGGRPEPTEDDLALLQEIGAQASVAIGHGVAYQRSREHALTLQRSMLTDPPDVPGMRLGACYRPAGRDAEIGGDWYDAFPLPGGELAVVIGDVVGHDIAAAASMGQLRSMLRALAVDTRAAPDEVLGRLDGVVTALRVASFATLLYGRIRRAEQGGALHWAQAGHPPPVLLERDGTGRLLTEAAHGMALGVRPSAVRDCATAALPPGSTLLLYTDGLIERRGEPDDDVVARCAELGGADLDELCDELLAGAPPHDDVALLAVRMDDDGERGATGSGTVAADE